MNGQYYPATDLFHFNNFPEITQLSNYSAATTLDFYNEPIKVYNVHFYGLQRTDATSTGPLSEDSALAKIAALNIAFNPYNIFFKYRGVDYYGEIHNGSELINQSHANIISRMYEIAQSDGYDNCINILLHHEQCSNDKGTADIYKKMLSFRYCTSSSIHVVYQMGHLFGLLKTQLGTGGGSDTNDVIPLTNSICSSVPNYLPSYDKLFKPNYTNVGGIPENVTRDINNSYYNADTAGDMVVDTPACFRGSEHNFCHINNDSTWDYISNSNIVDNSPEHLMFENVDLRNYMSLNGDFARPFNICHFTNGQGVRMRETLAIPSLNFNAVETTVASLYDPYKIENIYTLSTTTQSMLDNGDGTAEVCRWNSRAINHYFQPGFDYDFYQGNNLKHHNDKEELYGILDEGILRSVKISQINTNYIDITNQYVIDHSDISNGIIFYEFEPCNSPSIVCETEPYIGGKVSTTSVISNPVDLQTNILDSLEISDPDLEQNLENNKYHIIKKTTISGAKIQKTIYKVGD